MPFKYGFIASRRFLYQQIAIPTPAPQPIPIKVYVALIWLCACPCEEAKSAVITPGDAASKPDKAASRLCLGLRFGQEKKFISRILP